MSAKRSEDQGRTSYLFSGEAARAIKAFRELTDPQNNKSWKLFIVGLARFYSSHPEPIQVHLRPRLPDIEPVMPRPRLSDSDRVVMDNLKETIRAHASGRISSTAHALAEIAFTSMIDMAQLAVGKERKNILDVLDRHHLGDRVRDIIEPNNDKKAVNA